MSRSAKIVDLDRDAIKRGLSEGSIRSGRCPRAARIRRGAYPGRRLPSALVLRSLRSARGQASRLSCAAGVRSVRAIELAQAAGLDLREHYKGGFKDWAASGEPVE